MARARFRVINFTNQVVTDQVEQPDGSYLPVTGNFKMANLQTVDGDPDNAQFFKDGSPGYLSLNVLGAEMSALIDIGKEFYLDFTPAN